LEAATDEILASDEFIAFEDESSLDEATAVEVARIVALYRMNDASLVETSTDPDELAELRQRLLDDTVVRLRVTMPAEVWDDFDRSKLLPGALLTDGGV
jgi:hypothetical protein